MVFKRFIPLLGLGIIAISMYLLGLSDYLQLEKLRELDRDLGLFVLENPLQSAFIFIGLYILVVISMVPGVFVMDLIAGYLFGQWGGAVSVLLGSFIAALILFLSTKYAFGDLLLKRDSKIVQRLKEGFDRNQVSYLLFLRIAPMIPFGIMNIALGLLDIKLKRFIWTTAVGLCPIAILLTQAGTGIGKIMEIEGPISINQILNREIVISLIGIAVLALVPILFKRKKVVND